MVVDSLYIEHQASLDASTYGGPRANYRVLKVMVMVVRFDRAIGVMSRSKECCTLVCAARQNLLVLGTCELMLVVEETSDVAYRNTIQPTDPNESRR